MTGETGKRSDLGVRTASAVVMVAVAGGALWAGGSYFQLFVSLTGLALVWEFWGLISKISMTIFVRSFCMLAGLFYIGLACCMLIALRSPIFGMTPTAVIIGAVIATDVGAYFAGRNFGGPKIAPRISPSKTWSGLIGGMLAAGLSAIAMNWTPATSDLEPTIWNYFRDGAMIAVIAQIGDFFQSWIKRKAGVKDSGNLIPGHGGFFDRADGLIAVFFFIGVISLVNGVVV